MKQLVFPYTEREAEKAGVSHSSEANRNCMFARRLAQLRAEVKMSQQKLADMLEVSKSTISLYETGDTVPDAKSIVKIADIFGVSTDYFLCQTEYRSNERERMTVIEAGLTEEAAKQISNLDVFTDGVQQATVRLPFSPGGTFNQVCEDERFQDFAYYLGSSYQMRIGAENSQGDVGGLDAMGARAVLSQYGETGISMSDASELYLQRACDMLKDIMRDLTTHNPQTGEPMRIDIRGNSFNPTITQPTVELSLKRETAPIQPE